MTDLTVKDVIYKFDKTKDLVEKLLEKEQRCREDDKWLCYRVVQHFTKIYIPFQDFKKFPSFESISRCRRKIQYVEGKYLPQNPKVIKRRNISEEGVRQWSHS